MSSESLEGPSTPYGNFCSSSASSNSVPFKSADKFKSHEEGLPTPCANASSSSASSDLVPPKIRTCVSGESMSTESLEDQSPNTPAAKATSAPRKSTRSTTAPAALLESSRWLPPSMRKEVRQTGGIFGNRSKDAEETQEMQANMKEMEGELARLTEENTMLKSQMHEQEVAFEKERRSYEM